MIKKKIIIFITSIFFSIIIACAFFYMQHRKLDHISCNAFYIAKSAEARLVSQNHMELNDEIGSWMMSGRVKINNNDVYYFKLRTQFSVKRWDQVYYFTNNNVVLTPTEFSENKILQEFVADILRIKNAQSFFTIKPVENNYVIYSGEIPVMYCMNSKT